MCIQFTFCNIHKENKWIDFVNRWLQVLIVTKIVIRVVIVIISWTEWLGLYAYVWYTDKYIRIFIYYKWIQESGSVNEPSSYWATQYRLTKSSNQAELKQRIEPTIYINSTWYVKYILALLLDLITWWYTHVTELVHFYKNYIFSPTVYSKIMQATSHIG